MKTEKLFFDNFAVRIIIAVLTSALGISLIQGIAAEDCAYYTLGYFWEEIFFYGKIYKKICNRIYIGRVDCAVSFDCLCQA